MISHLADTNWVVEFLRNREAAVRLLRPLIAQASLAISIIVYGEIYEGLVGDPHLDERLQVLSEFLASVSVLGIDLETAQVFGRTRSELRSLGTPVPDHDIWIAATALRHDLTLLTRDQHFARIRGLKL